MRSAKRVKVCVFVDYQVVCCVVPALVNNGSVHGPLFPVPLYLGFAPDAVAVETR